MSERLNGHGGLVKSVALAASVLVGASLIADKAGILPHVHLPHIGAPDLGTGPENGTGAVNQDTYQEELDVTILCGDQISVGVDTHGFMNGAIGDGVVNKRWYGDFLLCGDENKIESTAVADVDPVTGQKKRITVLFPALEAFHPRIDELDPDNCAAIRPGDTPEETDKKRAAYQQKVKQGKKPACDDGFHITQTHAGDSSLRRVIDATKRAAQLAMALDADPQGHAQGPLTGQIAEKVGELKTLTKDKLAADNPGVEIVMTDAPKPSDDQILEQRFDTVRSDVEGMFTNYEFKTVPVGKGKNTTQQLQFYAEANGGGHVTVNFTEQFTAQQLQPLNVYIQPKTTTTP